MPKIRGIKPEFWSDEDIVELSVAARLLFIGMWTFACDNGHLDDKPRQLRMRVFPADRIDVEPLLQELVEMSRITREDGIITILKFAEHQRPHKRWWTCCDTPGCVIPEDAPPQGRNGSKPSSNNPHNRGATVAPQGSTGGPTADGDGDGECDGDGDSRTKPTRRARQLPSNWAPNEQHAAFAATNHLDLNSEAEHFKDHSKAKGATMKDWDAAFRTWMRNSIKFAKAKQKPEPPKYVPDTEIERPPVVATDEELAAWYAAQRAKKATA